MDRWTKPRSSGFRPSNWAMILKAAMVKANRALKLSHTRCITFLKWHTSVSMDSTISTIMRCPVRDDEGTAARLPHMSSEPVAERIGQWLLCLGGPSAVQASTGGSAAGAGDQGGPQDSNSQVIQLPLSATEHVTIETSATLTEDSWNRMITILNALKPGLVAAPMENDLGTGDDE